MPKITPHGVGQFGCALSMLSRWSGLHPRSHTIFCCTCQTFGPSGSTKASAINKWNRWVAKGCP
jgi:hypothetical protein